MKRLILICMLLLTVSCSMTRQFDVTAEEEFETAYVGVTANDILNIYGKPTSITSNGNNGVILIYEEYVDEFMSSGDDESSTDTSSMNYSYSEGGNEDEVSTPSAQSTMIYRYFYIGRDSMCYKVETNDYLKGGVYRRYFNRVTIAEMGILTLFITLLNIFI